MLVLAAAWCPAVAAALDVGISDQQPAALGDPRLAALSIDRARLIVPWDAALVAPASVDPWLRVAAARGLSPLVAFGRGAGERCPFCRLPTDEEYAVALAAFRARWPWVRELTPWNEPNHPDEPTARDPAAAARFHDLVREACRGCLVVAGDLLDSAAMKSYFRRYAAALRMAPMVWGIHSYGDVTYDRPSYTEWLLGQVSQPVWMTETGGIVHFFPEGEERLPYDEARAADSVDRVFALAAAHPDRIERVYFYHWAARAGEVFDAGFVRPDGSERPSLARLRAHVGVRPPQPQGAAAVAGHGTSSQPPAGAPDAPAGGDASGRHPALVAVRSRPLQIVGRPRRRHGRVVVPVRCPPSRPRGCHGHVAIALRLGAGVRPVVVGDTRVALRPGARGRVAVRVPRPIGRLWRAVPRVRVTIVSVLQAPSAIRTRTWNNVRRRPKAVAR